MAIGPPPSASGDGAPRPAPFPLAPLREVSHRPGGRRGVWVAIAVSIGLSLALSVVWVAGAGPFRPGASEGPAYLTFGEAVAIGRSAAQHVVPGASLIAANGAYGSEALVETNLSEEYGAYLESSACNVTTEPGAPARAWIAPGSTPVGAGASNLWMFQFGGSGGIVEVAVLNGSAYPIVDILTTTGCPAAEFADMVAAPSQVIDTPEAVGIALANGGQGFVSKYSAYDSEWALVPVYPTEILEHPALDLSPLRWAWYVVFSTCDLAATGGTSLDDEPPVSFTAEVNATSGSLVNASYGGPMCTVAGTSEGNLTGTPSPSNETPPYIGDAFDLGSFVGEDVGGTFSDNASVLLGLDNLTWGQLRFEVETSADTLVGRGLESLTVTGGPGGCEVAAYNFTYAVWSDPPPGHACSVPMFGPGADVVAGDQVAVSSLIDLTGSGDALVAIGEGNVTGSDSYAL